MKISKNHVTALIGPSGCGKSTLLRCFNRLNDLIDCVKISGEILLDDKNIHAPGNRCGYAAEKSGNGLSEAQSFSQIRLRECGIRSPGAWVKNKTELDKIVEQSLRHAAIWDEVKDRLNDSALGLSGGQQQRLCIARTLAVEPEVILMDEPCSALDPIATAKIENLIDILKQDYTVIIVTHNMQQAARVSDYTGFMYLGKLIECGKTEQIFEHPKEELTENYITGRFG